MMLTPRHCPVPGKALAAVALAGALALCGCKPAGSSQDVATGKDFALSKGEFSEALSHVNNVPRGLEDTARRNVLAHLIQERLLANAGAAEGLERDPVVLAQIEAARRVVLAKAYATRLTANVSPPSDREIGAFYAAHPEAFANRKDVVFDQVLFAGAPADAARLAQAFDHGTAPDALKAQADRAGVPIARQVVSTSSDRLPTAVAQQVQTVAVGTNLIFPVAEGVVHAALRAISPAPLLLDQARPMIRETLLGERRDSLLQKEIARLRQAADVKITDPALARPGPDKAK